MFAEADRAGAARNAALLEYERLTAAAADDPTNDAVVNEMIVAWELYQAAIIVAADAEHVAMAIMHGV